MLGNYLPKIGSWKGHWFFFHSFPAIFPSKTTAIHHPPGLAGDGTRLDALGDLWHRDDLLASAETETTGGVRKKTGGKNGENMKKYGSV